MEDLAAPDAGDPAQGEVCGQFEGGGRLLDGGPARRVGVGLRPARLGCGCCGHVVPPGVAAWRFPGPRGGPPGPGPPSRSGWCAWAGAFSYGWLASAQAVIEELPIARPLAGQDAG